MSLSVILYGKLQKHISDNKNTIKIDPKRYNTIIDVINELGIDKNEISHIFLDHSYSDPNRKIKKQNKRLALFPKDMALLYKWYFQEKK